MVVDDGYDFISRECHWQDYRDALHWQESLGDYLVLIYQNAIYLQIAVIGGSVSGNGINIKLRYTCRKLTLFSLSLSLLA